MRVIISGFFSGLKLSIIKSLKWIKNKSLRYFDQLTNQVLWTGISENQFIYMVEISFRFIFHFTQPKGSEMDQKLICFHKTTHGKRVDQEWVQV